MLNSKLFLLVVVAFLCGVALGGLYLDGRWLFFALLLGVFLIFLDKHFVCLGLLIFACLSGVLRIYLADLLFDVVAVGGEVEGCVMDEVDVRVDKVNYTLDLEEGRVLVSAGRYPVYEYGDCLVFEGGFKGIDEFDGGGYAGYLKQRGIAGVFYADKSKKVGQRFGIWARLFALKSDFLARLNRLFAEPHSSFMAGLLLGARSGLPADLTEKFNTTGLTHIIAISGYNISLVIIAMNALFGFLGRRVRVVAGILSIILFVVLVGASAAVVRAALMGIISLMALSFGRKYFVTSALFAAVFLMVLWNPFVLMYDKGAWLSFLATAGIVYASPFLEQYFEFLPSWLGLREAALMTVSAQVLVLPVIIFVFGRLSLVSVIANIFVLPLIPLAMLFGFMAVLCAYLLPVLGPIFAFVTYLILQFIIFLVDFFAALPFASLEFNNISIFFLIGYYFLILRWFLPKFDK